MSKTIHRDEYKVLLRLIRECRVKAGLTQAEFSAKLGRGQSYVSDIERGVRRLDLMQLRDACIVLQIGLPKFVRDFERELKGRTRR